jgi:hypothetical protein
LFGIDHCLVNAFHCGFKIHDLAFADAARRRVANAQDFDGAIRPTFPDNDTDFGGANLQADDQIIACHRVLVLPLPLDRSGFGIGRCVGARFRRWRCSVCRRMHRNCFQNSWFHGGLDRLIDDFRWSIGKGHGDIPLHEQVQSFQFLL